MFGASMMLVIEGAQAKGENPGKIHFARMFWLAVFGLAHYFLLWFGDILFLYASVGCIAFLFRNWEPRRLIKWALIIFGLGLLLWGAQFTALQLMQYFANLPGADADLVEQYRKIINSPDFDMNIAKELALHRGPYWPIVADKLSEWYAPLMMIGMAMKKNGFITGKWARADYIKWIKKLVPAGLLLSAVLAAGLIAVDHDVINSLAVFLVWSSIPRLMLTIGYVAMLVLLIDRLAGGSLIARVEAAGQAAFTNYLGTSIVMTSLFYGYGLGLYGNISRIGLWPFVFGAWIVMLLWSKPWLARFRYGPLEYVWRSLARGKLQKMVR